MRRLNRLLNGLVLLCALLLLAVWWRGRHRPAWEAQEGTPVAGLRGWYFSGRAFPGPSGAARCTVVRFSSAQCGFCRNGRGPASVLEAGAETLGCSEVEVPPTASALALAGSGFWMPSLRFISMDWLRAGVEPPVLPTTYLLVRGRRRRFRHIGELTAAQARAGVVILGRELGALKGGQR